jgi:hypothetical protein
MAVMLVEVLARVAKGSKKSNPDSRDQLYRGDRHMIRLGPLLDNRVDRYGLLRRIKNRLGAHKEKSVKYLSLLLLSFSLAAASALAMRVEALDLYASTSSGNAAGELYIINQSTGAMIQDIGPLNDANNLNYGMTGLAFDPVSGVLYGSTASGSPDPASRNLLVTINPATGRVTVKGPYNLSGDATGATMTDIAFDPTTGVLYGIGSVGGAHLYSIDKTTGHATLVGNSAFTATNGGGVAVSSAGTVYGTPLPANFGTYDKTTGAYTDIANPDKPTGRGYGALAFDGAVLYGLNVAKTGAPELVTIDTTTGAVTDIGPTVVAVDGIAFRPPPPVPGDYNKNGVVDAADYPLWRKGDLAADGTGPGGVPDGVVNGLDYTFWRARFGNTSGSGLTTSAVPEPAVFSILISGVAILVVRRRAVPGRTF